MTLRSFLVIMLTSILMLVAIAVLPTTVKAAFSSADLMCVSCQMDPKKPLYCPTVPCFDITSGQQAAAGMCGAPGKCLAQSAGGMPPMLPMLPMPMMMPSMDMPQDPCMQPGAGVRGDGTNATTSTSTPGQTNPC